MSSVEHLIRILDWLGKWNFSIHINVALDIQQIWAVIAEGDITMTVVAMAQSSLL